MTIYPEKMRRRVLTEHSVRFAAVVWMVMGVFFIVVAVWKLIEWQAA